MPWSYLNKLKFELVGRAAGQVQFLAAPNRSFTSDSRWPVAGVELIEIIAASPTFKGKSE